MGNLSLPDLDMLSQVHEAAAFGVDGQTGLGRGLDGIAEAQILGQGPGVGFGEAAADIEGVQVSREHRVVQGADFHHRGARFPQGLQVLGIIKLEGGVPDDADDRRGAVGAERWPER